MLHQKHAHFAFRGLVKIFVDFVVVAFVAVAVVVAAVVVAAFVAFVVEQISIVVGVAVAAVEKVK